MQKEARDYKPKTYSGDLRSRSYFIHCLRRDWNAYFRLSRSRYCCQARDTTHLTPSSFLVSTHSIFCPNSIPSLRIGPIRHENRGGQTNEVIPPESS